MNYTREQIAKTIDLAVLKPDAIYGDVARAAKAVSDNDLASVCVASVNVSIARPYTDRVCAVVGFPHGNVHPAVKVAEAGFATMHGAKEIDFVLNYGHLLSDDVQIVEREIRELAKLCKPRGIVLKAILETCYYMPDEIWEACKLCVKHGVDFVKTSTGFGPGGATPEAVKIMVDAVDGKAQVKASGGIKTYRDACVYLDLGCTRLGSSAYKELLPNE